MADLKHTFYAGTGSRVMICGKSQEQIDNDIADGIARVGGHWRRPNYFESYLQAAHLLIEQGKQRGNLDDIGLPAFYLQRHAVELLLKSLVSWMHGIRDLRIQLKSPEHERNLDKGNQEIHTHDHVKLLLCVSSMAAELGFPKPPDQLEMLIKKMVGLEQTETWSRYGASRGRRDKSTIDHMKVEAVIPLLELQENLLEVSNLMTFRDLHGTSYENVLADEWDRLYHIVDALRGPGWLSC